MSAAQMQVWTPVLCTSDKWLPGIMVYNNILFTEESYSDWPLEF